jgi:hypothetical protein
LFIPRLFIPRLLGIVARLIFNRLLPARSLLNSFRHRRSHVATTRTLRIFSGSRLVRSRWILGLTLIVSASARRFRSIDRPVWLRFGYRSRTVIRLRRRSWLIMPRLTTTENSRASQIVIQSRTRSAIACTGPSIR